MPQIWMTYPEAGEHLGCSALEARAHAIACGWPRKRSRDGHSRLRLPESEIRVFMERAFQRRLKEMMAPSVVVHDLQKKVLLLEADLRAAA